MDVEEERKEGEIGKGMTPLLICKLWLIHEKSDQLC